MEENKRIPRVYPDPMRGAEQSFSNQTPWEYDEGLNLRDYFANSAMKGIISASVDLIGHGYTLDYKSIAERAYEMADAMLDKRHLKGEL